MRRLEKCNVEVANNRAARLRRISRLRSWGALSERGDEVLPRVTVTLPKTFVKTLIEPRELRQRPRN